MNEAFCVMEPEIWKDVSCCPDYYQVSSHGRVRSKDRLINIRSNSKALRKGKILKPCKTNRGYYQVHIVAEGVRSPKPLSHLVALEFVENKDRKPIVGHLDNNPENNYYKNLVWCTHQENTEHMFNCGRENRKGKRVAQIDLSGNVISEFDKIEDVAKIGYCPQSISGVINGRGKSAYGFLWKEIIEE